MTVYSGIYQFTPRGMSAFKRVFEGTLDEGVFSPVDPEFATLVKDTKSLSDQPAETAKDLAQRILDCLGEEWGQQLGNKEMWAWLTFVLRDVVFPKDKNGQRKFGEVHRWYPSEPGDFQKAQRHLIRMPVTLLGSLGDSVDHMLCGKPSVPGELREQLTSQQDMLEQEFQKAARLLYFDEDKLGIKRGAAGKGAGSCRRLATLRKQLDVTWNLFDLDAAGIVDKLPKEFDRFKPKLGGS